MNNQLSGSARVISVCVSAEKAKTLPDNAAKATALEAIVGTLGVCNYFGQVDAVVLPGGFFRLHRAVGSLAPGARRNAVSESPIGELCRSTSVRLNESYPGVVLAIGLDTEPALHAFQGDQIATAWRAGELVGLGCKTFPVGGDTDGIRVKPLRCYAIDYADPFRVVSLANGSRALLCSCYDVFGVRAAAGASRELLQNIRYLSEEDGSDSDPPCPQRRRQLLRGWRDLIQDNAVDVVLATIHEFEAPGRDGYWQRHGIAGASAAIRGLVVGAAHFTASLPVDPHVSPLAACSVPHEHLDQGPRRRAHPLRPIAHDVTRDDRNEATSIVRLFEGLPLNI
jgi:hypothetical protein